MPQQTRLALENWTTCCCRCPSQVLVIDCAGGPASVLVDTISLLSEGDVSVTVVDDFKDALRALTDFGFGLVVVGLVPSEPLRLSILPQIAQLQPAVPVLAVGRDLPRLYQQYARNYGAREVLNLPQRANDLKALMARMTARYLDPAAIEEVF